MKLKLIYKKLFNFLALLRINYKHVLCGISILFLYSQNGIAQNTQWVTTGANKTSWSITTSTGVTYDTRVFNGTTNNYATFSTNNSLTINFGETKKIDAMRVYCSNSTNNRPTSVTIEGSTDGVIYTNIMTRSLSFSSSGTIRTAEVDSDPVFYQYIRLRFTRTGGNSMYIYELDFKLATANIPVTGINLPPGTIELFGGETATPSPTILPETATNKTIIWSSSDPSVATVSANGVITAIHAGNAVITATTADGGYSATCTVSVKNPDPVVLVSGCTGINDNTGYASLQSAFNAVVSTASATDDVKIKITRNLTITSAAVLTQPTNGWNSLTIYPTNSITLTSSAVDAAMQINGSNVIIDGRVRDLNGNLTNGNKIGMIIDAYTGAAIIYTAENTSIGTTGNANISGNKINYCTLRGASDTGGVVNFTAGIFTGCEISNCELSGLGRELSLMPRNLIYVNASGVIGGTQDATPGLTITNNQFNLWLKKVDNNYAIYDEAKNPAPNSYSGVNRWDIDNNTFSEDNVMSYTQSSTAVSYGAISLSSAWKNNHVITDNIIGPFNGTSISSGGTAGSETFYGINIKREANGLRNNISSNTIKNINISSEGALYSRFIETEIKKVTIDNNKIQDISLNNNSGQHTFWGIHVINSNEVEMDSNQINGINLKSSGSTQSQYLEFYLFRAFSPTAMEGSTTRSIYNANGNSSSNLFVSLPGGARLLYRGLDIWYANGSILYSGFIQNCMIVGPQVEANSGTDINNVQLDFIHALPGSCDMYNNFIADHPLLKSSYTQTGGFGTDTGITGIRVDYGTPVIWQNIVVLGGKEGASTGGPKHISGIWVQSGVNIQSLYHNTIVVRGSSASDYPSAAIYYTATSGLNVRNNIFYNRRSTTNATNNIYAIYSTGTALFTNFTNNNLYAPYGSYINGGGNLDNSNINHDPEFINVEGFTPTDFVPINDDLRAGYLIPPANRDAKLDVDFGGYPRVFVASPAPTMGAWEFQDPTGIVEIKGTATVMGGADIDGFYPSLSEAFALINTNITESSTYAAEAFELIEVIIHGTTDEPASAVLEGTGNKTEKWKKLNIYPSATVAVTNKTNSETTPFENLIEIKGNNVEINGNIAGNTSDLPFLKLEGNTDHLLCFTNANNCVVNKLEFSGIESWESTAINIRPQFAIYTSNKNTEDNITIQNCFFENATRQKDDTTEETAFIYAQNVSNWKINNNHFYETLKLSFSHNADYHIISLHGADNCSINNNYIGGSSPYTRGNALIKEPTDNAGGNNSMNLIYVEGNGNNGAINTISNNIIRGIIWKNNFGTITENGADKDIDFICINAVNGKFEINDNILGSQNYGDPGDATQQHIIQVQNAKNFYGIKVEGELQSRGNILYRGIYQDTVEGTEYNLTAISLDNQYGDSELSDNFIVSQDITSTDNDIMDLTTMEIINNSTGSISIYRNEILAPQNISFPAGNTTSGTTKGISVAANEGSGKIYIYSNILVGESKNTGTEIPFDVWAFELRCRSVEGVDIFHNTISLDNTLTKSSTIIRAWAHEGSYTDIRNNIFYNNNGTIAGENNSGNIFQVYMHSGATFINEYNDLKYAGKIAFIDIDDNLTGDKSAEIESTPLNYYTTNDDMTEALNNGTHNFVEDAMFKSTGSDLAQTYYPTAFLGASVDPRITDLVTADFFGEKYRDGARNSGAIRGLFSVIWIGKTETDNDGNITKDYYNWGDFTDSGNGIDYGGWRLPRTGADRVKIIPFVTSSLGINTMGNIGTLTSAQEAKVISLIFSEETVSDLVLDQDVIVSTVYNSNAKRKIFLNGYTMTILEGIELQNGAQIDAITRFDDKGIVSGPESTIILNSTSSQSYEGDRIHHIYNSKVSDKSETYSIVHNSPFVDNKIPKLIIRNNSEYYALMYGTLHVTNGLDAGQNESGAGQAGSWKQLNAFKTKPTFIYGNDEDLLKINATQGPLTLKDYTFYQDKIYNFVVNNVSMTNNITNKINDQGNDQHLTILNDFTIKTIDAASPHIQTGDKQFIIPPAFMATALGITTNNSGVNGLVIKADPNAVKANGTFVFRNGHPYLDEKGNRIEDLVPNVPVPATVEFYSVAHKLNGQNSGQTAYDNRWQYFTVPVVDHNQMTLTQTEDMFAENTLIRQWVSDGLNPGRVPHWEPVNSMQPFYGYEITDKTVENPQTYSLQGNLINDNADMDMVYYEPVSGFYGQYIFGNPYTAAIEIDSLEFGDELEKTVYLFNTGSYDEWVNGGDSGKTEGKNPGQYLSVPQDQAGQGGLPEEIPSLQGFLVKFDQAAVPTIGTSTNLSINYSAVAKKNQELLRSSQEKTYTTVDLSSENYHDRLWIFLEANCSRGFDNGWDGRKIIEMTGGAQLFTVEVKERFQVSSLNDVNNLYLGIKPAKKDTKYTLTFLHHNMDKVYPSLYLIDLENDTYTDITADGSTYTFVANTPDRIDRRFKISTTKETTAIEDVEPASLRVYNSGKTIIVENTDNSEGKLFIYDVSGRLLQTHHIAGTGTTKINTSLSTGVYVAKAQAQNNNTTKTLILK